MRKLVALITLVTALVAVPVASAKIVVQKSIAGVRLGIAENDVVATLGQPAKTTNDVDEATGQPTKTLYYGKTKVTLVGGVVAAVFTTSKKEKTSNGVGVGSSETSLKKQVKGLKCIGTGSIRSCTKGTEKPGGTVTIFAFSAKKKIKQVSVQLVID